MDIAMRPALRTSPSRPKPKNSGREKTSLSGRLPAISVMFSSTGPSSSGVEQNVAQHLRTVWRFLQPGATFGCVFVVAVVVVW